MKIDRSKLRHLIQELIAEELSDSDAQALALGHTRLTPNRGPRGTGFDPLLDVVKDPEGEGLVRGRYSEADPDVLIRPGPGSVYGPGGVRFSYEGDFGMEDTEIVPEDPGDWPEDMSKFLPIETEPLGPSPGLPYDPYDPDPPPATGGGRRARGGKLREAPRRSVTAPRRSKADPDVLIRPAPGIPDPVTGTPMPGTGGAQFSYEGEFAEPEHIPYDEPSEPVSWDRPAPEPETELDEPTPETKKKKPDLETKKKKSDPRPEDLYQNEDGTYKWVYDDVVDDRGIPQYPPVTPFRPVLPGEANLPDQTGGDQFDWLLDEVGDLDQYFTGGSTREGGLHPAAAMGNDVIPYDMVRQHARDKHGLRMKTHEDSRDHWAKNWREIVPMATAGSRYPGSSGLDPEADPAGALRALYKRADAKKLAQLRASGLSDEQIRTGYRTPEDNARRSRDPGHRRRYKKGDYSYFLDPAAPEPRAPRSPPGRLKWEPYKSGQWGTEGQTDMIKGKKIPREYGTPYPRERNYLGQDVSPKSVRNLIWTKGKWRDSWEEAPKGTVITGEPEIDEDHAAQWRREFIDAGGDPRDAPEAFRDDPRFLDLKRRESRDRRISPIVIKEIISRVLNNLLVD